jgi:hypothetical protein
MWMASASDGEWERGVAAAALSFWRHGPCGLNAGENRTFPPSEPQQTKNQVARSEIERGTY